MGGGAPESSIVSVIYSRQRTILSLIPLTFSSPLFSYGIAGSSSSPWTAGYAMQSDGYDETLHLTTTSHSTISFNMTGKPPCF